MPSPTEIVEFIEDSVEDESPCCDNIKISKEDGFFVCLNCGFVSSRILLEPGLGDPNLHEDDPWVEICGYYDREKLINQNRNNLRTDEEIKHLIEQHSQDPDI
ncbi:MAG: hypothetical protein ACW986_15150 [Promethearchaeota archaeon]|jgi:hypothetical protein